MSEELSECMTNVPGHRAPPQVGHCVDDPNKIFVNFGIGFEGSIIGPHW